jgi:hypothetical protein
MGNLIWYSRKRKRVQENGNIDRYLVRLTGSQRGKKLKMKLQPRAERERQANWDASEKAFTNSNTIN